MTLKKEFVELDSLVLEHLRKYYDLYVSKCKGAKSFNYWLSCVLLNRLIELDILTVFGLPNPFIFPPEIELNVSSFPSSEQFMNKVDDNA